MPLFSGIDDGARAQLVEAMAYRQFPAGTPLCEQGTVADRFFVIVSGQCAVTVQHVVLEDTAVDQKQPPPARVGTLYALDFLGEAALLQYDPADQDSTQEKRLRSATVTAEVGTVQALELHRDDFDALVNSGAIGADVLARVAAARKDRQETNRRASAAALAMSSGGGGEEKGDPLSPSTSLDQAERGEASYSPVHVHPTPHASVDDGMQSFSTSEEALAARHRQRQKRHSAAVQMRVLARQRVRQTKALSKAPIFSGLADDAIEAVLAAMEYKTYAEGAALCVQGEAAECFFVIVTGQCGVTVRDDDGGGGGGGRAGDDGAAGRRVGTLHALDILGENALLDNDAGGEAGQRRRNATVTAEVGTVQVLELHRDAFEALVAEEGGALRGTSVRARMRETAEARRRANLRGVGSEKAEVVVPAGVNTEELRSM